MSLKVFHLFFITVSALTSWGLATWAFRRYQSGFEAGAFAGGIAAGLLGALLTGYGIWFYGKLKRWNGR